MKHFSWLLVLHSISICILVRQQNVSAEIAGDAKWPIIKEIRYKRGGLNRLLEEPKDYFIVGYGSDSQYYADTLFCATTRADQISWQFKKQKSDSWTESTGLMAVGANTSNIIEGQKHISQEISYLRKENDDLRDVIGFYRCVAKSFEKSCTVHSWPIKFIIAQFVENISTGRYVSPSYRLFERKNFGPRAFYAVQNQPFVMPCFPPSVGLYGNTPTIAASEMLGKYTWRISQQTFDENYITLVDNSSRLTVDPVTGAINFAYSLKKDNITKYGKEGVVAEISLYCYANVASVPGIALSRTITLNVTASDLPIPNIAVLTPPSEEVDQKQVVKEEHRPICYSQRLCEITVIFGGLLAQNGKLKVFDPNNTELTDASFPGLKFIPPISNQLERYTAKLVDANKEDTVFETLYIDVIIKNLPVLEDQTTFPKIKYAEEGKIMELVCKTLYTNKSPVFYHNGNRVTPGDSNFVTSVNGDVLRTVEMRRANSGLIQCENDNDAGIFYASTVFEVVAAPNWTFSYTESIVTLEVNVNLTKLQCSVQLDAKTTSAEMYWMYQTPGSVPIRASSSSAGVKNLAQGTYDKQARIVESSIDLEATFETLCEARWWCQASYTYAGETSYTFDGRMKNVSVDDARCRPAEANTTDGEDIEQAEQAGAGKGSRPVPFIVIGIIVAIGIAVGVGAAWYKKHKDKKNKDNAAPELENTADAAKVEMTEKHKEEPQGGKHNVPEIKVKPSRDTPMS